MKVFATQTPKGTELSIASRPPASKSQDGSINFRLDQALDASQIVLVEQKIHKIYKIIQYLGIAIFAAMSLFLGRRIQPFYGAHLIFALHFYSFVYVLTALTSVLSIPTPISMTLRLIYLTIALWRLTGSGSISHRRYGVDWKSFGRAYLLFMLTIITELFLLGSASAIGLRLIH